jgi:methionyl-tRNA formyltransferase
VRIGLLGSKGTTLDFLNAFEVETGHRLTHLVTLSDDSKAAGKVAFYQAGELMDAAARAGLTTCKANSYTLTHPADQAFFKSAELDVLFVLGWERILPDSVLQTLRCGAFGMHGSPYGLPRGRGRSPMNWSLIHGHSHFVTSLFRYTPGIDDGDVVGDMVFTISDRDDAGSLHLKNRLCMLRLAGRHLPDILSGEALYRPQPNETPSYYPKRTPQDGAIDWSGTTQAIDRLVRAVAPPYPGAFTELGQRRLTIEAAQPFEGAMFSSSIQPGTVLDVSPSMRRLVVKTGDGSLFVTRFSGVEVGEINHGDILHSSPTQWTHQELTARYGQDQPEDQWEVRVR